MDLLTFKEAAPMIRRTESALYRMAKRNPNFETVDINGRKYVSRSVIDDIIKNGLPKASVKCDISERPLYKKRIARNPEKRDRPWLISPKLLKA